MMGSGGRVAAVRLLLVALAGWGIASAGFARAADLPPNVRQAISTPSVIPTIQQFVKDQVALLGGEDLAAQGQARDDLSRQAVTPPGGPAPTAQFLDAYAKELNDALLPLSKNAQPRVRLNAAIVAERVSRHAKNGRLQPLVVALLADENDATRMWALKAARNILPYSSDAQSMVAAVQAIGKEATSGSVVQTVYDALTIDQGTMSASAWAAVLAKSIPALQEAMRARLDRYRDGIPEDPSAELTPMVYLSGQTVWRAQTPPQQDKTIQLISDLIGVSAQRSTEASNEQRQEIVWLLRRVGGTIDVAGKWSENPQLQAAARDIQGLDLLSNPERIKAAAATVYPKLQQIPRFKDLKPPPNLDSASSRPPATTNTK